MEFVRGQVPPNNCELPNLETPFNPTKDECRALLHRILDSLEFQRARRLRDFLTYVVDRKLADATHEVTEVLVGQRVFGRPATYNPGDDSIVRTEARILRQRLEKYFAAEGRDEPFVLEIPRGGYVPEFRSRDAMPASEPPAPTESPSSPVIRRPLLWLLLGGCVIVAGLAFWKLPAVPTARPGAASVAGQSFPAGRVELTSSDPRLVKSFQWAKARALGYAYTGDGVGDWYDSTAGERYAFCMRDTSHQSVGAAVLGLMGHTRNMLRRFAASIAASRDWCGFWEINKDGFPAPVDYVDDKHFWYCLPANFDVMHAAFQQFLWTGDESYFDAVFSEFYDRSVTDYVSAWDPHKDGIMESDPKAARRGIPSYHQEKPRGLIGGDLVAEQYVGYLTYAAIEELKGRRGSLSQKLADEYRVKAQALRVRYNTDWWSQLQSRYYSEMLADHTYYDGYIAVINAYVLRSGITEDGLKTEAALDSLEKNKPEYLQTESLFAEILFKYGRNEAAYANLLELMDPTFQGRGMPEIVFAAVGATGQGLMGISPDARGWTVETLPRLPKQVSWAKLAHVPVLRNQIAVEHRGTSETIITNETGPLFQWKATFPASAPCQTARLLIDGLPVKGVCAFGANRQPLVSAVIPVKPGQTRTARYVAP